MRDEVQSLGLPGLEFKVRVQVQFRVYLGLGSEIKDWERTRVEARFPAGTNDRRTSGLPSPSSLWNKG